MKWICLSVVAVVIVGCSSAKEETRTLTLATTTSTRDSGLLDVLIPMFERETGLSVKVVAVGSGQAIELGRRGDADVLLTHAPDAEELFMAAGYGEQRRGVMHNDFVLVGPQMDPASVKGQTSIKKAFGRIAQSGSPFVSRGDESGTHMKERKVWKQAGIDPQRSQYVQSGMGMAEVLRMASEKRAYTLTDRSTFLAQGGKLDLAILSDGDPLLRNPYSVIVVSSEKHPSVNADAARRFSDFLLSAEVQRVIGEFGVELFQQPLFFSTSTKAP